jgi:NAD(P)-dependent dehydrogenase (short-subunit alcohol dehydrogenase family)
VSGRQAARRGCAALRGAGWKVAATDLDAARLDALDVAGVVARVPGDIRQAAACRAIVERVVAVTGRVDALVNAAGVWREGPVEECSEEDFDVVLDVNLKGTFFLCAAAIPHLRRTQGCIVNISSDAGRQGNLNAAAYCASKGGVTIFTKALALELAHTACGPTPCRRATWTRPCSASRLTTTAAVIRTRT